MISAHRNFHSSSLSNVVDPSSDTSTIVQRNRTSRMPARASASAGSLNSCRWAWVSAIGAPVAGTSTTRYFPCFRFWRNRVSKKTGSSDSVSPAGVSTCSAFSVIASILVISSHPKPVSSVARPKQPNALFDAEVDRLDIEARKERIPCLNVVSRRKLAPRSCRLDILDRRHVAKRKALVDLG